MSEDGTQFIDPEGIDPNLSWNHFTASNLRYISSKDNKGYTTIYWSSNSHDKRPEGKHMEKVTPETQIHVAVNVPYTWCKKMTDGGYLDATKYHCKAQEQCAEHCEVPMALKTTWNSFETDVNGNKKYDYIVSSLGHKFRLVFKKVSP